MTATPSEIFALALKRHRTPWNWTLHFSALVGFAMTLFSHSYLMFAATLILFGAGFFELNMPDTPDNRWFRFVKNAVDWEKNWSVIPWNFRKLWRFGFALAVAAVTIWALWTREPATLALLLGFAVLIKVVRENKDCGIDP